MPGVWLGNVTAGIRVILILRLFVVVEGGLSDSPSRPHTHRPGWGSLAAAAWRWETWSWEAWREDQGGLCLVRVVNCWVFSLIVVIDTTVERGVCFIS